MVSVQEPGLVRFWRQIPTGERFPIHQDRIEMLAPGGGAADGLPANVSKPDTLVTIDSDVMLEVNDLLVVTFEPDGADTLDASDCIIRLPIATASGSSALGNAQFQDPPLTDQVLTAEREVTIMAHFVTKRMRVTGRTFFDLQDDTA